MRHLTGFQRFCLCALIFQTLVLFVIAARAETPKLLGRVNDHAGVLTVGERATLERKLAEVEKLPGNPQLVVLLPADMGGLDIERYANDTFRAWGIGQKGVDNGVLVIIAPKERKWRIEVGYGLEGQIPDSRAKSIITNDMDPHLRGGKAGFYEALAAATTSLATEMAKEKPVPTAPRSSGVGSLVAFFVLFGGIVWLCWFIIANRHRRQGREAEERLRAERAAEREVLRKKGMEPGFFGPKPVVAAAAAGASSTALVEAHQRQQRKRVEKRREPERSRSRDDDSWSSSSSSSYSSSSSDSSSFSSGGGDSGGGGASGGD